jgi:hypothetical protein
MLNSCLRELKQRQGVQHLFINQVDPEIPACQFALQSCNYTVLELNSPWPLAVGFWPKAND